MARTFEEIVTEINTEQAQYPELNVLDSPSADSFWKLLKNMFAFLVRTYELGLDKFRAEIDIAISSQQIGTLEWYVNRVKEFQYGDLLQVSDNKIFYAIPDATKQIIKQASATETLGGNSRAKIVIKAVKSGSGNTLVPLTIDEHDALKEYIKKIKFAGVTIETVTLAADTIKLKIEVQINRLMLNPDGSRIGSPTEFPVKTAIVQYLRELPFDGTFYWTQLTDRLQLLDEIKDVVIQQSWYWNETAFVEFGRLYAPASGHLILDENSIINYVS